MTYGSTPVHHAITSDSIHEPQLSRLTPYRSSGEPRGMVSQWYPSQDLAEQMDLHA